MVCKLNTGATNYMIDKLRQEFQDVLAAGKKNIHR